MSIELEDWIAAISRLPYFERRLQIADHVYPPLSRFVYKYRTLDENDPSSIDRVRDIVANSNLWLSSPEDFNDPFDMSATIVVKAKGRERRSRIKRMIKEQGLRYKDRKIVLKKIFQGLEH